MHRVSSRWHPPQPTRKKGIRDRNKNKIESRWAGVSKSTSRESEKPNDWEFFFVHKSYWEQLCERLICPGCNAKDLSVVFPDAKGFSILIQFKCKSCGEIVSECYSSPRVSEVNSEKNEKYFVANRRMVDAVNTIGLGHAALERLCIVLNMNCLGLSSFHKHLRALAEEAKQLEDRVLLQARNAVREAHIKINPDLQNQEIIDTGGSYDGTWPYRGHCSLYGVGIVIDTLTGIAFDFEICSKFCLQCEMAKTRFENDQDAFSQWHAQHIIRGCNINYEGSSGSMEVECARRIWTRSPQKSKVRIVTLVGDGDVRSWEELKALAPYGEDVVIDKEECINHVHKRLGTGLRKLAKEKRLGGRKAGALKETTIIKLQNYYRKAIVDNAPDVKKMQNAIQATLDHYSSTDENPKHQRCPRGEDSWCFYNQAQAKKLKPSSHAIMRVTVSENVAECIQPLYDRLSSEELLSRCTQSMTQNANESLHSLIWRKCPKEVFVSLRRIRMAVVSAIAERNMGITEAQRARAALRGEDLPENVQNITSKRDNRKRKRSSTEYEQKRKTKRRKKKYGKKMSLLAPSDYASGAH